MHNSFVRAASSVGGSNAPHSAVSVLHLDVNADRRWARQARSRGFGQEFCFVSASVCHSRNWNSRSNSFVRAASSGGGSNAPRSAVTVLHLNMNADRGWSKQARMREFRFICILGGIRPSYSWILAYVQLERINTGRNFQTGIIFKMVSKFLPDDAFFMAASKRFPCRSYYCCVSFSFGSAGIVLCNQRRMCSEYDSHRDHIWYSGLCALETQWIGMIVVSVLLSIANCSSPWRGDRSGDWITKSEIIN